MDALYAFIAADMEQVSKALACSYDELHEAVDFAHVNYLADPAQGCSVNHQKRCYTAWYHNEESIFMGQAVSLRRPAACNFDDRTSDVDKNTMLYDLITRKSTVSGVIVHGERTRAPRPPKDDRLRQEYFFLLQRAIKKAEDDCSSEEDFDVEGFDFNESLDREREEAARELLFGYDDYEEQDSEDGDDENDDSNLLCWLEKETNNRNKLISFTTFDEDETQANEHACIEDVADEDFDNDNGADDDSFTLRLNAELARLRLLFPLQPTAHQSFAAESEEDAPCEEPIAAELYPAANAAVCVNDVQPAQVAQVQSMSQVDEIPLCNRTTISQVDVTSQTMSRVDEATLSISRVDKPTQTISQVDDTSRIISQIDETPLRSRTISQVLDANRTNSQVNKCLTCASFASKRPEFMCVVTFARRRSDARQYGRRRPKQAASHRCKHDVQERRRRQHTHLLGSFSRSRIPAAGRRGSHDPRATRHCRSCREPSQGVEYRPDDTIVLIAIPGPSQN